MKQPTRAELEEEIKSLALTVKFLMNDVEYLLGDPGPERKEAITQYILELKDFLKANGASLDTKEFTEPRA